MVTDGMKMGSNPCVEFRVMVDKCSCPYLNVIIPITLHYLNLDPAIASGVFLTTVTDSFGFFTFLTLAYLFLI
jgi:magnesium transporter